MYFTHFYQKEPSFWNDYDYAYRREYDCTNMIIIIILLESMIYSFIIKGLDNYKLQ